VRGQVFNESLPNRKPPGRFRSCSILRRCIGAPAWILLSWCGFQQAAHFYWITAGLLGHKALSCLTSQTARSTRPRDQVRYRSSDRFYVGRGAFFERWTRNCNPLSPSLTVLLRSAAPEVWRHSAAAIFSPDTLRECFASHISLATDATVPRESGL
jgi:hypothetical protein